MENKKRYLSPTAHVLFVLPRDVICSSNAFEGPGDTLFPKLIRDYYDDPDQEWV